MTIEQYFTLLLATFCFELIIYGTLLYRIFSKRQILAVCFLLNIITHPLVCLVFPRFFGIYYWIPAELFAWLVEAQTLWMLAQWMVHYKMRWTRALLISLAANSFSAGLGLLFFSDWPIP
jgi:hypothetical protein